MLEMWKRKYLSIPNCSFHAVDFYENNKKGYRKNLLRIKKSFDKAHTELIDLVLNLHFQAKVFYVDMKKVQKGLKLHNLSKKDKIKVEQIVDGEVRDQIQTTKTRLKNLIGADTHYPIKLCIQEALIFHSEELKSHNATGSIYLDSRKEFDTYSIEAYHSFNLPKKRDLENTEEQLRYIYGKEITAIHLQTKATPDAGIEIADLVSYLFFQYLRGKHSLYIELDSIEKDRLALIRKSNASLFSKELVIKDDLTKKCIIKLKKLTEKRLAPLLEELTRSSSG